MPFDSARAATEAVKTIFKRAGDLGVDVTKSPQPFRDIIKEAIDNEYLRAQGDDRSFRPSKEPK